MLGKTLKQRYRIEQLLAKGEQGALYLGTDAASGEMLAVKVFSPQVDFRGEGGLRYLRAMHVLGKLSHPHLLIPLDTGFSEGCAFQVTPYMPAQGLHEALAEAPFSPQQLVELLRQAAEGLVCLHAAGLPHLNLKPSNLLVAREGERLAVVVCDPARPFLAPRDFPYGGPQAAPYRAPEEIPLLDGDPGPRADLYALGMIGYLIATGKPPFNGLTARQVALHHLAAPPPPLKDSGAEVGEHLLRLEPILRRLAKKEPAARYPSAAALLADLAPGGHSAAQPAAPRGEHAPAPAALSAGATAAGATAAGGNAAGAPPLLPLVAGAPLVGRAAEAGALASSLARAGTGRGTLLVLAGAPGIGKRALFERLVPRAAAGEALVLRAALPAHPWCAPLQAPLLWLEDLAAQWEWLPLTRRRYLVARLKAALGANAAILAGLFPPLGELLEPTVAPPALPPERESFRTLHVITETLAALAENHHPLVLWLGGVEGADPDTAIWLEALLQRLPNLPLLLVAGYAPAAGPFQTWIQEAVKDPAVQWVEVPPLQPANCQTLTHHLLRAIGVGSAGADPERGDGERGDGERGDGERGDGERGDGERGDGERGDGERGDGERGGGEREDPEREEPTASPLPQKLAAWIYSRWGGNPLAFATALSLLRQRNLLEPAPQGGEWDCRWEAMEALKIPDGVAGLLARHAALATEDEQFLLGAAAVFPGAFALEELGGLMEHLPPEVVLERVEQAIAAGLLRRGGGKLAFSHPSLREAYHAAVPEGRKTHFHRLLGSLREAAPGPAPIAHHHATARHFLLGGDPTRYVRHGLAVAQQAGDSGAVHGAARWLQALLPHLGNDVRLPQALTDLADYHLRAGRPQPALDALAQCQGLELGDDAQLGVLRLAAAAEIQRGEGQAAVPLLEEALGLLGETLPGSQMGAALARLTRGARRRYAELRFAAGGAAPTELEPREAQVVHLLEQMALALAEVDGERAELADEKLVQFTAARLPTPPTVRALVRLGEAHGNPDDPYLTEAGQLAAQGGFLHEEAERQTVVGRCRFNLFDLPGAREALFRAHEGFGRFGDPVGKTEALRWVVEVERLQGPAGTLLDRAQRMARLRGLLPSDSETAWGRAVQSYCEALAGKRPCGEAAQELKTLAEKARDSGLPGAFGYFLFLCADLLLGAGRGGDARNCLEGFPAVAGEGGDFWGLLLDAARAESYLLQARATPEDREWHLKQAAKRIRRLRAASKPFPRLALETARLEMMAQLLAEKTEAALELAHQWEGLLDAQNARIALGRMLYRLGEGLKEQGKPSWRPWAERALSLFETTGAAPFAAAARELLEQSAAPPQMTQQNPAFPEPGNFPPGNFPAVPPGEHALLEQLEGVLREEPNSGTALHRGLLHHLAATAGADFGVLLLPDGEGRPEVAENWPQTGEPGEINRWLVDTVWKEKRPELVQRFLLTPEESRAGPSAGGAQTALCVPLAAHGTLDGVVYLARGEGPRPFDQADLSRAVQAARQAALALALGGALAAGQGARRQLGLARQRWELLTEWSARAAEGENSESIMASFLREAGYPNGFQGALLYWADAPSHRLRLGPCAAEPPPGAALEPFQTLALLGSETSAAKALAGAGPTPAVATSGNGSPGTEGELLAALGAKSGLWLPLGVGEKNVGAVLLYARQPLSTPAGGWEGPVGLPLRLIAPALFQARRAELVAVERDALAQRENQLLETTHRLQRFVPAQLRDAKTPSHNGTENWSPVTFGQIFDTGALAGLGARETLEQLHAYYGRVHDAVALHQGVLERIMGPQWVARYERGAENALWGTLTMYQMLLRYQDERAALGAPTLRTGLGVHLGSVIAGTVETEQRVEPVLVGEGVQVAARLAEMCRTFRAGILVSAEAVQGLEDPAPFDLRSLGFFRIGPGGKKVGVYELFSTREAAVLESMRTKRGEWNAALRHYQLGQWKEGADLFRAYLDRLPQDRPARHFLRHCRQRAAQSDPPPPAGGI